MEGPYLKELEDRGAGLKFRNRRLEIEYRSVAATNDRINLRIQMIVAFTLIGVLMFLDHRFMSVEFSSRANVLRAGIMLPSIVALLLLTWSPRLHYLLQPVAVIVGLTVGLTALFIGGIAAQLDQPRLLAGFVVIIVFIYFLLGLRMPVAIATAGTLVAAFCFIAVRFAGTDVQMIYNTVFLVFLNIICALGAFQMERNRRTMFLEERVLNFRANHDALTQMPNRRAFDDVLSTAWDNAISGRCALSMMMIDIDNFKDYNDEYGHQAGDDTIRAVGAILRASLQRPQDFAGRYGGEEFVVLLFDSQKDYALRLAEMIRRKVQGQALEQIESDAAPNVTVSIGLAHLLPHERNHSKQGFVQMADEALYAAKQRGRNRVVDADTAVASTQTGVFRVLSDDASVPPATPVTQRQSVRQAG